MRREGCGGPARRRMPDGKSFEQLEKEKKEAEEAKAKAEAQKKAEKKKKQKQCVPSVSF